MFVAYDKCLISNLTSNIVQLYHLNNCVNTIEHIRYTLKLYELNHEAHV